MRALAFAFAISVCAGCSSPPKHVAERPPAKKSTVEPAKRVTALFPLTKGAEWTYRGSIRSDDGSGRVVAKEHEVKMKVLSVLTRGEIHAAVMHGHPQDPFRDDGNGSAPSDYLILWEGGNYYMPDDAMGTLARLGKSDDSLEGLTKPSELVLWLPPKVGEKRCPESKEVSDDVMYCWSVESEKRVGANDVGRKYAHGKSYRLVYRTRPDATTVTFAPGVGITRYEYVHNGSVLEGELELVQFHPGE